MSVSRQPAAEQAAQGAERWAVDADLHARVLCDMTLRPDAYADVPQGTTLVLVPDDDQAHAEWAIRRGAAVARRGANVYLRRTVVAELPEVVRRPIGDPTGSRRIVFTPDGTVQRVTVKGEDGAWHEVEPTPEDAAGLPPSQ